MLKLWLGVSIQSFGGGNATFALIRRAFVEDHRWISAEDFSRDWALVQLAPGINLIALAVLIGRNLGGARGIVAAVVGLLVPSAVIAVLITAGYAHVQNVAFVKAALRGIVPATIGIGIYTTVETVRPILAARRRAGRAHGAAAVILLATAAGLEMAQLLPVIAILALVGAASAVLTTITHVRPRGAGR